MGAVHRRSSVLADGVLDLVAGVADLVLDRAGRAIDLALALEVLVAGHVTGRFLRVTLELVCGSVAHGGLLSSGHPWPTHDCDAVMRAPLGSAPDRPRRRAVRARSGGRGAE